MNTSSRGMGKGIVTENEKEIENPKAKATATATATAEDSFGLRVLEETEDWLEKAVIGLNLCPFAQSVWRQGSVRMALYGGDSEEEALERLGQEIAYLIQVSSPPQTKQTTQTPQNIPNAILNPPKDGVSKEVHLSPETTLPVTTLLVLPNVCADFWDFLSLVQSAQRLLKAKRAVGQLQIAHFHPHYQFAHTEINDPENYTNRSPYPTLHLLREADIEWATEHHPDVSQIYQNNVTRLNQMGHAGWVQLGLKSQAKCPKD